MVTVQDWFLCTYTLIYFPRPSRLLHVMMNITHALLWSSHKPSGLDFDLFQLIHFGCCEKLYMCCFTLFWKNQGFVQRILVGNVVIDYEKNRVYLSFWKDMHYYQSCLEAILQNSPDAKVFCLVHKMDLVQDDQRELVRELCCSAKESSNCRYEPTAALINVWRNVICTIMVQ